MSYILQKIGSVLWVVSLILLFKEAILPCYLALLAVGIIDLVLVKKKEKTITQWYRAFLPRKVDTILTVATAKAILEDIPEAVKNGLLQQIRDSLLGNTLSTEGRILFQGVLIQHTEDFSELDRIGADLTQVLESGELAEDQVLPIQLLRLSALRQQRDLLPNHFAAKQYK